MKSYASPLSSSIFALICLGFESNRRKKKRVNMYGGEVNVFKPQGEFKNRSLAVICLFSLKAIDRRRVELDIVLIAI